MVKQERVKMTETRNLRKGFSLIEIMIVILIIGVLAAAAFGGFRWLQNAKLATTNTKLAAVDTMLETYSNQIGEYPSDLNELVNGPTNQALTKRWGEPIATQEELEDSWKQPLMYERKAKGARPPYDLYSIGSKGTAHIYSPRSKEQ